MKSVFRDKTKVKITAGNGGHGGVFFDKMRRPSGGFGGDGGHVFIEGDSNMPHFTELRFGESYIADQGQDGGKENKAGRNGESLLIKVPLVTNIYDENGEKIAEISEHKQRVQIVKGGRGGVGNFFYRKGGFATKEKSTPGRTGRSVEAALEFELDSDVILVGFPNAGKSSLISELTNANSKIGAYAFTTIHPVIGLLSGLKLLDLPGLIEDTHLGKGLGINFVKHTRRTRMVAHFVSFENEDMIKAYKDMRQELEKIDKELSEKPEVILLTKSDLATIEERNEMKKKFEKSFKLPVYVFSTFDLEAIGEFKVWIKDHYKSIISE